MLQQSIKVSKRDFLQFPNKYLKKGIFILTLRGEDYLEIEIKDVTTSPNVTTNNVTTTPMLQQDVTTLKSPPKERVEIVLKTIPGMKVAKEFIPNWQRDHSKYACGCAKLDEVMCSKHGRI